MRECPKQRGTSGYTTFKPIFAIVLCNIVPQCLMCRLTWWALYITFVKQCICRFCPKLDVEVNTYLMCTVCLDKCELSRPFRASSPEISWDYWEKCEWSCYPPNYTLHVCVCKEWRNEVCPLPSPGWQSECSAQDYIR